MMNLSITDKKDSCVIQAKCIDKYRDKNNKITGYKLIDLSGNMQEFNSDTLKNAIINERIHVVNLKLTSDGRLIDVAEKNLPYKESNKTLINKKSSVKQNNSDDEIAKAFRLLHNICYEDIDAIVKHMTYVLGIEIKNNLTLDEIYSIILHKNPMYLITRLKNELLSDDEYCINKILDTMYNENVNKLSDSKVYKAVYLIYKYANDRDKNIGRLIKKYLIDDMKKNGVVSTKVGYEVGHEYFRYLDNKIFGTITNSYFTVEHELTGEEKKEFKELKTYSYKFSKNFNIVSPRPEVGLTFCFKNGKQPGKVIVEIKMHRNGYIGKSSVSVVGYIKDLDSFTLDINNRDNAKIVADKCNKLGLEIREFCNKHKEFMSLLPLGAELERGV